MKTFVDVVGYQLEKVHTGVIKYLLEWENEEIEIEQKRKIVKNFYERAKKPIGFEINEISNVHCIREYSSGRNIFIDLVITLELISSDKHHMVLEMKVDSIPGEKQLENTVDYFSKTKEKADYFLLLIGSSSICKKPENYHKFSILSLEDIISIFSNIKIKTSIYQDWINSLKDEVLRRKDLLRNIENLHHENIYKKEYWLKLNYRYPFPLFYYLYYHLRKYLNNQNTWEIFSGNNNPVMNWKEGWVQNQNDIFGFYWEFNYENLILKISYNNNHQIDNELINRIRYKAYSICEYTKFKGKKTRRKYGKDHSSIFKWEFDFLQDSFNKVANIVDNEILSIHPEICILQRELNSTTQI